MAYSSIIKPSTFMNTVLYTGNGGTLNVTGVGFKPDFTWIKPRAANYSHNLTDIVRGVGKGIFPDLTATEYDYGTGTNGSVRTFDSDGFSLGSATQVNPNGVNIASWNWKETSTAGFDIVAYTGNSTARTISHNLGSVPKTILIKNLANGSAQWVVYHVATGNTHACYLNTTTAKVDVAGFFNDTTPTSSVFTLGTDTAVNGNGNAMIAYCFSDIQGYSKFSTYEGNGNADGTFTYTGFKPAFLIVKPIDATDNWVMFDNKSLGFNSSTSPYNFYTNTNGAQTTDSGQLDFVSNGFKIRNGGGTVNKTSTYIYLAFAEEPFVASNYNVATAR